MGAGPGDDGERDDAAAGAWALGGAAQTQTRHASQQDPVKRAACREQSATTPPEALVLVDETGATRRLTRPYARAPRGPRAVGHVPRTHGTPPTRGAALTPAGLVAPRHRLGAMTTARFTASVQEGLGPGRRPGHVVVLDTLRAHQSAAVRALIAEADCTLVYRPA